MGEVVTVYNYPQVQLALLLSLGQFIVLTAFVFAALAALKHYLKGRI